MRSVTGVADLLLGGADVAVVSGLSARARWSRAFIKPPPADNPFTAARAVHRRRQHRGNSHTRRQLLPDGPRRRRGGQKACLNTTHVRPVRPALEVAALQGLLQGEGGFPVTARLNRGAVSRL